MIRTYTPTRRVLSLLMAAPFVAVACTTSASGDPTEVPATVAPTETVASAETAEATIATEDAAEASSWLDIELSDAQSGETFTLASLAGKVVAIEPMAVWCSNCKVQQDNVKQVYSDIEAAGVHYISLGIDPGEDPGTLAKYAQKRGYDWTFVQSPSELSRALSDLFGPQILSAPSTPLIVLDENGEPVTQEFGFHSPEKLVDIFEEAGAVPA